MTNEQFLQSFLFAYVIYKLWVDNICMEQILVVKLVQIEIYLS